LTENFDVIEHYNKFIYEDKTEGTANLPEFFRGYNYYVASHILLDPQYTYRTWWEAKSESMSLMNFMNELGVN
jgi:ATP-dependent DNA helicase RecQ